MVLYFALTLVIRNLLFTGAQYYCILQTRKDEFHLKFSDLVQPFECTKYCNAWIYAHHDPVCLVMLWQIISIFKAKLFC